MNTRDFQRTKCYRWERASALIINEVEAPVRLSMDACVTLAGFASDIFGLPTPHVKDGRGTSIARGGYNNISLPLWARSRSVTVHETAHYICKRLHVCDKHGPNFIAVYAYLLVQLYEVERKLLWSEIKASGLKIRPYSWAHQLSIGSRKFERRYR